MRDKIAVECLECGRKFKTSGWDDPSCPKCGGVDIDIRRPEVVRVKVTRIGASGLRLDSYRRETV